MGAAGHGGVVVMGVAYRHVIWPGMKWKYATQPGPAQKNPAATA